MRGDRWAFATTERDESYHYGIIDPVLICLSCMSFSIDLDRRNLAQAIAEATDHDHHVHRR